MTKKGTRRNLAGAQDLAKRIRASQGLPLEPGANVLKIIVEQTEAEAKRIKGGPLGLLPMDASDAELVVRVQAFEKEARKAGSAKAIGKKIDTLAKKKDQAIAAFLASPEPRSRKRFADDNAETYGVSVRTLRDEWLKGK